MGAKLAALQSTENLIAGNIVNRATQLQQSAQQTALTYIIITVIVLLIVLLAALLVARSLVLPLRRLRAGALDIASVQLPERVRLLSENPESAASMEVAPINVASQDEIGQVARAFDQVHSEAVRLAGEQALLRSSFNAMFVNLSRRSQTLIERLARMIDNLEQNEDDPDRLGSLFSMDHLVTRMRRNSENLLLLAGHENPRKWSDAVPLADIARAATSEIEQYNRVTLNIPPGVSVIGQAVSDVVHLLAELVENATIFSPKDTQVQVGMQELTSGGVLIEVVDKGIGVSDARLTRHELAARQPADDRRVRLPAHGPVRRRPAGRAAPGPGPAAARAAAGTVGPGLAAGQRHRAERAGSARARAAGRRSRSARGRGRVGGGRRPHLGRAGQPAGPGNGYANGGGDTGTPRLRAGRRRAGSAAGRTARAGRRPAPWAARTPASRRTGARALTRPARSASRPAPTRRPPGCRCAFPGPACRPGAGGGGHLRRPGRASRQDSGERPPARERAQGRRTAARRCRSGHRSRHVAASPGSSAERAGRKGKAAAVARHRVQERGR